MDSAKIRVFYSWQSDLPSKDTRYFIQDCIDRAVKALSNTVEVIADRDTKNVLGTPDITQTIFAKIEDCDLFIADVSIINKYTAVDNDGNSIQATKLTPNPNVLLELGYAAAILTWDNVICIINTEYGSIEDLPFDLARRRVLPFSFQKKDKPTVRKEIRDVIISTVTDILETGPRAKSGFANHILGSYSLETSIFSHEPKLIRIQQMPAYITQKNKLVDESKALIEQISKYSITAFLQSKPKSDITTEKSKANNWSFVLDYCQKQAPIPLPVIIDKKDQFELRTEVQELLGIELPDEFFNFGNLQKFTPLIPLQPSEYLGSEDEKNKLNKYKTLRNKLMQIKLIDIFADSFKDKFLILLAIQNNSVQTDEDITITISVDISDALAILPTASLFNDEYRSKQGCNGWESLVFENDIIKNTLMMPENHMISYDLDISYDIQDAERESLRDIKRSFCPTSIFSTIEDYERELQKYIAFPVTNSHCSSYEFHIERLRPNETKWLGPAILIQPKSDRIKFSYLIKSKHTTGTLSGTIQTE